MRASSASRTVGSSSATSTRIEALRAHAASRCRRSLHPPAEQRGRLRHGTAGDPDLDRRSLAGSGIDPQPAAGQGCALLHRRETEMARHRLELLGNEPDAVVGHPDSVALVALVEHDGRVLGVARACGRSPGAPGRCGRGSFASPAAAVRFKLSSSGWLVVPSLWRLVEIQLEGRGEPIGVERRWAQLEEKMSKSRDRELDRLLELAEQLELLGVVEAAAKNLQPHSGRGDRLDGVVVDAHRDPAPLLLAGAARDEPGARARARGRPASSTSSRPARSSTCRRSARSASRIAETFSTTSSTTPSFRIRFVSNCSTSSPCRTRSRIPGRSSGRSGGVRSADRAADDLLRGVSVHSLRPEVPGLDRSDEVLADDGVVRGFDDRRELPGGDLASLGAR